MNIMRIVLNDVQLDGFNLPKGTCVNAEISAVLYDENV
jgi:cytochrome P450